MRNTQKHTKRKNRIVAVISVLLAIAVCAGCIAYSSNSPYVKELKSTIRNIGTELLSVRSLKYVPLENAESTLYIDNRKTHGEKANPRKDNKLIERTDNLTRLTDFCTGFSIDLPDSMEPDFSHSPNFVKMTSDFLDITISKERSPYEDIDGYIEHYLNRFITDENLRKNNSIELLSDGTHTYGKNTARVISVKITDMPEDKKNVYTYATINTVDREFFRLLFKFRSDSNEKISNATEAALSSFVRRAPLGAAHYDLDFSPEKPDFWSRDTKKVYNSMARRDDILWGIFHADVQAGKLDGAVGEIEEKLDFTFPVILTYNHMGNPLADGLAEKCAEQGRMLELTVQMTETNNIDLYCKSPLLETYKGKYDDKIRALARQIKEEIKLPFFFRLNNEMNTDWTNYSGVINLADPEIYVESWRRVYNIFKEEGVDNAIWVFNPNDRNYPPCNWNNFLAYYPGDEYVQMIGVTGYNTGTYFKDVTGEDWRSFTEIYDEVNKAYSPFFADFPWIITEFASSSVGGNKPMWIDNMFKNLHKYPNIKVAVWFSAPDMDMRPGYEGKISRPYMLDETEESLSAFGEGIKKTNPPEADAE